ncbi:formiminoglutamate deiminase [Kineococcus xinjiangensis]|uniref:Formiminoglutamate deiminase n=1 Tax=Kineococcus xinjiangensis TaxID=512762 RepID=A0A2S6IEJ2_9ACTN|nr:formiminoglutamate deiminase [Kineococcus xinjiangensis]
MREFWAESAWLPSGVARDVLLRSTGGVLTEVLPGTPPTPAAQRLPGLVLPAAANAHSHAFHRALRGRTHAGEQAGGSFWTWREAMYAAAGALDPQRYERLATAVFAEMVLAGFSSVGEFHYVHHRPDGSPHPRSEGGTNAMAHALRSAARSAGIRLTLLDVCYLTGGLTEDGFSAPSRRQRRFTDASAAAWAERVAGLRAELPGDDGFRTGVAVHSVRAVPAEALPVVVAAAAGRPLHVHLSEQPAENSACLAHYGRTPTRVLADAGVLGPTTTAVHATHLTDADVDLLGATRTAICLCPTTERDLADGLGPGRRLADAGSPLCVGTDQHAVVDPFEEARGVELHERLATHRRGSFTPAELLTAMTSAGHAAIGWPEAGRIAAGAACDLVAVATGSPRTAGALPEQVLLAATAADVHTVVVAGRVLVEGGRHVLGDVGGLLAGAITDLHANAREATR